MNHYFITGASAGIGKSMAEALLADEQNTVHGLSRSCVIEHSRYQHHTIDLADTGAAASFTFDPDIEADKIVLINNAGNVGELVRIGDLDNARIVRDYNINLVSPSILTNNFTAAYRDHPAHRHIVNMSSAAAHMPVEAWTVYCASKAGLNLLSRTVAAEQELSRSGFRIHGVDPGIVDTPMQATIRSADETTFSRVNEFRAFKDSGVLASAEDVAAKIIYLIENPDEFNETIVSVADIQ